MKRYASMGSMYVFAVLCLIMVATPVAAAPPTLTFSQLCNGTGGCWFTFVTGQDCGLFHMYAILGTDPNGTIINPAGTLNVPLPDGNYTITLLGTGGSGVTTTSRRLQLSFNNNAAPDIEIWTAGPGPNYASFVSGATTITVNNITYVDGDISGFDRIAACDISQDGYTDTIATFDMVVSTVLPDDDGDGVPNAQDACPNSDLSATVSIDGCNSGVPNPVFPSGCSIADLIKGCATVASNHGQFVSCVAQVTNDLKKVGSITGQQKGAIQSCAAQAHIP